LQASIHLIRDARAIACGGSRAMSDFYSFNLEMLSEIEKAQQVSPLGFRIQIQPFGFIFIVATALTPDELLQRFHYHGERND
jgi:hypothetical protein